MKKENERDDINYKTTPRHGMRCAMLEGTHAFLCTEELLAFLILNTPEFLLGRPNANDNQHAYNKIVSLGEFWLVCSQKVSWSVILDTANLI